jgi:hypothetical protein
MPLAPESPGTGFIALFKSTYPVIPTVSLTRRAELAQALATEIALICQSHYCGYFWIYFRNYIVVVVIVTEIT